jgi:hypothetical protein
MSVAVSDVVKDVRQLVQDRTWVDVCVEAMDTTETGLDVADGTRWEEGAIVEFQDDGEQCYVRSVSSNTLTVIRNYNFSVTSTAGTGTSHSINTTIVRDPILPYVQITGTASRVLKNLWPYVYKPVNATAITPIAGKKWYDLADSAAAMALIRAWQVVDSTYDYPFFYGQRGGAYPIRLVNGLDAVTDLSASGNVVYIPHFKTDSALHVVYAAKITDTVTTGAYVDVTDDAMRDMLVYGIVAKVVAAYDIPRATQEDTTMGDETVRPRDRTLLGQYWEAEFRRARDGVRAKLQQTQPLMQAYSRGTKGIV